MEIKNNTIIENYSTSLCQGFFKAKVFEKKELVQVIKKQNLITFKMKECLAGVCADKNEYLPAYFKIGTNDNPVPAQDQGDLSNPTFQKNIEDIEFITGTNTGRVKFEVHPTEAPTGIYKEAALFTQNGKMISRILIEPSIIITDLTQFGVEWDLTFNQPTNVNNTNSFLLSSFANSISGGLSSESTKKITKFMVGSNNTPGNNNLISPIAGSEKNITKVEYKTTSNGLNNIIVFSSEFQLDILGNELVGNIIGEFALLTEDSTQVARYTSLAPIIKNATTKTTLLWKISFT